MGGDLPPSGPPVLDKTDIVDIFMVAAIRCGRQWPAPALPASEEDEWGGRLTETVRPVPRVKLPYARGFRAHLTEMWEQPQVPLAMPRHVGISLETEDMPATGLDGLPSIDRIMAAFLLDPTSSHVTPLTKDPQLTTKRDKDASAANAKLYSHLACAAKHLNATLLLQGSLSGLLLEVGDNPTPEQLAEIRRLHDESVSYTCTTTEQVGRAMTCSILAERDRWLEASPALPQETKG